MKKSITALLLSLTLGISAAHGASHDDIRQILMSAGLTLPIQSITPSPIAALSQVRLTGQDPLLISDDLKYIIQGNIETNPSPAVAMDGRISTGRSGTPISQDHKAALLANMTALGNIDQHAAFYHTHVKGVLWGMSSGGSQFLVSADGRYFINGEISMIENGQFTGLDQVFERTKNRHALSQLDERTLITYPAKTQHKATLYIATDINCPYCRIFHNKINHLNQKGITIKAIGYPVYDESVVPMQQIWCHADNAKRALLLSAAMKGINSTDSCQNTENPLTRNQITAHSLAIFATPAIFNDDGALFQGDFRQSDDELLEFLNIK